MASAKEIKAHLEIALKEIGKIKPAFSKRFKSWTFRHPKYPDVEYYGNSPEEVIENYPKYLKEFIKHRLNDNIWASVEKKTKGRGGKRQGAGRPKGTKKEPTKRIVMPKDIAEWVEAHRSEAYSSIRHLVAKSRY